MACLKLHIALRFLQRILDKDTCMYKLTSLIAIAGMLCAAAATAQRSVELEALLGKTAVLMIDGQRKTMRVGQSESGVTLVTVQPNSVTLQLDGQTKTLGMSQRIGTTFQQPTEKVVTIARDGSMQYLTNATINGRSVLVLVDTGANSVAISSDQAKTLGIDYSDGEPTRTETASGTAGAYAITLQSVDVGGIEVSHVPAVVVDGAYPAQVLLGMSYLRHVKMQEHSGVLSLSQSH
jgi:aspartyl protease family protein